MKLDKNKLYRVTFAHCFDDDDVIEDEVSGRKFYRLRNALMDLGYQVTTINEVVA